MEGVCVVTAVSGLSGIVRKVTFFADPIPLYEGFPIC